MAVAPNVTHGRDASLDVQMAALPPFVRALLQPQAFNHPADDLLLHETHISWVVLAGPYAYKIKKPVNFGFLDFSTLERRAADCAAEVTLNRRLCPDVYLGVVPIVECDGAYRIGGSGRVVEFAVRMRRLSEEGMLPQLLSHDAVDARLMRRIARRLARFHATAATGPGVDQWGTVDAVRANWEENFAQIAPFARRTLPPTRAAEIERYVAGFLTNHTEQLRERVAAGCIRDGHGDLYAGNICVEGRRLHLFDCLEFSPRYRCADVAAEVAFLAMDLDHAGHAEFAAVFVDAYRRASGDSDLRAVLPFYQCYRAYVRGKVASLRLTEPGLSAAEEADVVEEARAYFDLAWWFAHAPARPMLIVTMGLPATGKTTLADALARRLGLIHLSSDRVRKELARRLPIGYRGEQFRQGLYDPAMTRRTYTALHRRAGRWLRRGTSVVLDATYGDPATRAAVHRLAARAGAQLLVLVCDADEATIRARLAARERDPTTISDARLALWPALRAAYTAPAEWPDAVHLDMKRPLPRAIERVLDMLISSS